MLADTGQDAPIEPRELHSQLKKKPGYGYLRDVQAQVLTGWHARRAEKDLVVKVNTGGGKTIDGLLILQSYLNEGAGPALYVAPSNVLVNQVLAEAANLGIGAVQDVDSAEYLRSEAVAVINIHELVNGRSKFSDNRPSKSTVPIGAVVIDDAHAALTTTREQLSLTVPRGNVTYDQLLQLFEKDLQLQAPDGLLDLKDDRRGTPVRVPFWSWREKLDEVRRILRTQTGSGQALYFPWPPVADSLQWCRTVFSNQEISITPFCPPIKHITSFSEAKHRIFLTATLADDSVLVTDFGADPESVKTPITPLTAGDIGERMILAPQEICSNLDAAAARSAIAELSTEYNTVVLVPSLRAAEVWRPYATQVAIGENVERAIDELRGNPHLGLVVFVNRYDGIDLPDDACRVLVLDGLPEAFSPEERLESAINKDNASIDSRQVQRIEQGMGRGVRSNEDHCVVFLLGPRLAQLVADPRTSEQFSPATRAQLELSRQVALQMGNQPIAGVIETARQALTRDPGWVQLALSSLRGIEPQGGRIRPAAIAKRKAFDLAISNDWQSCIQELEKVISADESDRTRGALLELQACYQDASDPALAQQTIALARQQNIHVTKPLTGIVYRRIEQARSQAESCTQKLTRTYASPVLLRLSFEALASDLEFDPERVEEFEEAFYQLGSLIGLASQRPERDTQIGPDNLWALGNNQYWVVEAKTGVTSPAIGKRDMGQLSQSMEWFRKYYDPQSQAVPVMVHPAIRAYSNASPVPGMHIITEPRLAGLATAVRTFATALSEQGWSDSVNVGRLLVGHRLDASSLETYLTPQQGIYRR